MRARRLRRPRPGAVLERKGAVVEQQRPRGCPAAARDLRVVVGDSQSGQTEEAFVGDPSVEGLAGVDFPAAPGEPLHLGIAQAQALDRVGAQRPHPEPNGVERPNQQFAAVPSTPQTNRYGRNVRARKAANRADVYHGVQALTVRPSSDSLTHSPISSQRRRDKR